MTAEDLQAVRQFMIEHTGTAHPQTKPGWLEWQFINNPDGFDVRLSEHDRALVGMSGFVPCRFQVDGTIRSGAFSTRTMVNPAHRGRGIGRGLHESRLQSYDWALSSGQSPANDRVYRRMGFTTGGRYRRLFVQTVPPTFHAGPRFLRELYSWLWWTSRRPRHDTDLSVELDDHAPRVDATFFEDRFDDRSIGPIWNHEHLVWRYERHPYFRYAFARVLRLTQLVGFGVIRRTSTSVVLADLYGRRENMVDVLRGLAIQFRGLITGQFVGSTLDSLFRQAGWITFKAGNRLMGRSNDPALHKLLTDRCWCFFGGDSDSDR